MDDLCSIPVLDGVCQVGIYLVSDPNWNVNGIMGTFLFPFTAFLLGLVAGSAKRKHLAFWIILIIGIFEAFIGAARLADLNQLNPQGEEMTQVIQPAYMMIWQGLSLIVVAFVVVVLSGVFFRRSHPSTNPPAP